MAEPNLHERIGPALGKIASGLYVATARLDGAPIGMLCSFVEQAGFEPPMISIALAPERPLVSALADGGVFGLHILSKENNALLKAFARGDNPTAFVDFVQVVNEHGVPQFADAWVFLACRVAGRVVAGDHVVHVAEILDGVLQHEGQEPLVRIRANGFGY